tara:strand:- start:1883 stop:2020 length:138 start_codon:yes stop_codon:yes gene_type:complete
MILTLETQQKLLSEYLQSHSIEEGSGWVDGFNKAIEVINQKIVRP